MAVVGDAYVMIHAITSGVDKDIKDGFKNADKHGGRSGDRAGRAFSNGFNRGGGGGWFKKFEKEAIAASKSFGGLTRAGYTIAPLIQAAAGTIGVLGTSLISLGSIIGAVALPAMVTLGGAMMSLAQAAVTVKLAFAGVGKAIAAGNKASKKAADNSKALKNANKALERAQRALAQAYEDANKSQTRAVRDLEDAEKDLHLARLQAIEDLQQLGFDSEDAAISEQKAAIELEKARETLARVSDLPPNSRARKEAELAFASADLNYRRAIDKNNDLKKTEAKNAAMGNLDAQVEGQKEVVAAIRARDDATDNLTTTVKDNAKAILSATENRDDAAQAVKDIKNNKAAADAYADALRDLSPEARKFVKYIVSLKDEFKKLKAAAGKDLFPRLETAMRVLVKDLFPKLAPLLRGTGKVIGDIAVKFSKVITNAENLKRLEKIWKTNDKFLGNLGDAAANLYEVFLILLDAAKPLIDAFGNFLKRVTAGWKATLKADEATGKLAKRFKIAKGIFKDLGKIFGNVFGGLGKLFEANTGPGSGGQIFLNYFKKITENFKNLKSIDGKPLKEFFAGAAKNGTKLLDLLGKIFGGFIKLADDPALGKFYDNLGKAVDILNTIDLGGALVSISELAITFADFIKIVTDSGSIETFFGVLNKVLKKLNKLLKTETGQNLLKLSAKILPVLLAFGFIAKIGGFAFKVVAGGILRVVKPLIAVYKFLSKAITAIRGFLFVFSLAFGSTATAILVGVVAAIVAVVAILIGAYTQSKKFRDSIAALGGVIKEHVIKNFNKIKKAINDVFGGGGKSGSTMKSFKKTLKSIGDFIAKYIMPFVKKLAGFMIDLLGGAITAVIYIIGALKNAIMFTFNIFKGVLQLLTGNFKGAGKTFKNAFSNLLSFFKNIFKAIGALLEPFGAMFIKLLGPLWEPLKAGLEFVWEAIKLIWDIIVAGVKIFISILSSILGFVWDVLKTGLELAWAGIQIVWDLIVAGVKIVIKVLGAVIGFVWDVLKTGLELVWAGIQIVWDLIVAGVKIYIGAVKAVVDFVWDVLKTGLELAWAGIQIVWDLIVKGVKGFIDVIKGVLSVVWDFLKSKLEDVWVGVKVVWDLIITGVKAFIEKVKGALSAVWNGLKSGLETAWAGAKAVWTTIIDFVKGLKDKITAAAAGVWGGLKNGLSTVINSIISGINFIIRAINKIKIPSIGIGPLKTPAIGFNLSEIAPVQLATGGVVRPSANGTFAQLAEAGKSERVEPLDAQGLSVRDRAIIAELSGGGKGTTVNMVINPSAGMDERELAAIVSRQIAFQLRRGAA